MTNVNSADGHHTEAALLIVHSIRITRGDGSAVKKAYRFFRGWEFSSQNHVRQLTAAHSSSYIASNTLL
ncbi:mCG147198 [Mus musculus]|nr:mCG147198 [Mus musculus]